MLLEEMYQNIDLDEIQVYTKVVGVSFYDRQLTINELSIGDKLLLKRDYKNQYDRFAIGVYFNRKSIGWLPRKLASKLAPEIDNGLYWEAVVTNITGCDKDTKGVNIQLIFIDK